MRMFEKISEEQFKKDLERITVDNIDDLYRHIQLPRRSTKKSAGYDIRAVGDYLIAPGETLKVPTGLKVAMPDDEVFLLFIRSSLAIKSNITLTNNVGVIDADYYNNNDNEGHFWITIRNEGDYSFHIKSGDRICQGIFMKYEVTDDDDADAERTSGFGSTGNK